MKAIEILFQKIDELNKNIQATEDIYDKIKITVEIQDVIRAIQAVAEITRYEDSFL